MWGNYFYSPSKKSMLRESPDGKIQETFVQYIMDPIVEKYNKIFN